MSRVECSVENQANRWTLSYNSSYYSADQVAARSNENVASFGTNDNTSCQSIFERKNYVDEASGNGQILKGFAGANRDLGQAKEAMAVLDRNNSEQAQKTGGLFSMFA